MATSFIKDEAKSLSDAESHTVDDKFKEDRVIEFR